MAGGSHASGQPRETADHSIHQSLRAMWQLNAQVLSGGQKEANELVRREGLWFKASRFQSGKVIIFRDHEVGRRRNGTVAEFVVVWIDHHHSQSVLRLGLAGFVWGAVVGAQSGPP